MKIKSLHIDNYKSLVNFKLIEPNNFSVFVGANGVGKSNIFEAIEFFNYKIQRNFKDVDELFGGYKNFVNANSYDKLLIFNIDNETTSPFGYTIAPYENYDRENKMIEGGPIILTEHHDEYNEYSMTVRN